MVGLADKFKGVQEFIPPLVNLVLQYFTGGIKLYVKKCHMSPMSWCYNQGKSVLAGSVCKVAEHKLAYKSDGQNYKEK